MGKSIKGSIGGFAKGFSLGNVIAPGDPFLAPTLATAMGVKVKDKKTQTASDVDPVSVPVSETPSKVTKDNPFGLETFGNDEEETGWLNESASKDLKLYKQSKLLGG